MIVLALCLVYFWSGLFAKRTGSTDGPILTIYTSYDVFLPKDVPFGGFVDIPPHLGGQIPKNRILGPEYAFPSQTAKIEKHAYCHNYCIDSNQILHSDKDHQMPFVGGVNMRITNPRWQRPPS